MKIAIGSDHGGYKLKKQIIEKFDEMEFLDKGTFSEDSCDYPDFAEAVCKSIQNNEVEFGIVICGTGIGISIAANKMKGIRAALCHNSFTAEMSRLHNNSNVLALGARVTGDELAFYIIKTWLNTSFEGGRHGKRVDKITAIENKSDK